MRCALRRSALPVSTAARQRSVLSVGIHVRQPRDVGNVSVPWQRACAAFRGGWEPVELAASSEWRFHRRNPATGSIGMPGGCSQACAGRPSTVFSTAAPASVRWTDRRAGIAGMIASGVVAGQVSTWPATVKTRPDVTGGAPPDEAGSVVQQDQGCAAIIGHQRVGTSRMTLARRASIGLTGSNGDRGPGREQPVRHGRCPCHERILIVRSR